MIIIKTSSFAIIALKISKHIGLTIKYMKIHKYYAKIIVLWNGFRIPISIMTTNVVFVLIKLNKSTIFNALNTNTVFA